jgi:hypothetical protein
MVGRYSSIESSSPVLPRVVPLMARLLERAR